MRLRNTLLLTAVFILLGAYLYFFEFPKGGKGKTEKLLNFKENEVERIILSYPQQEIRLQKEPTGKWKITHPLQGAADESTITGILSALSTSEVKRTLDTKPSPEELKNFGLDQPEAKVVITLKSGLTLPTIFVGEKTPVGSSAYVKRGSEAAILLTDASLRSSLEKKLNDFRDKEILPFRQDMAVKLQIHTPKESLVLVKGEKEDWNVESPRKGKAKNVAVSAYLTALSQLRAKGFAEDEPRDLKKYGLNSPALKISLEGKDGKTLGTLSLATKGGQNYFARREETATVYTIEPFSYNQLNKQLTDFLEEEKKEARGKPAPQGGTKK